MISSSDIHVEGVVGLSANAPIFVPQTLLNKQFGKVKKTKEQRACSRKRRRKKVVRLDAIDENGPDQLGNISENVEELLCNTDEHSFLSTPNIHHASISMVQTTTYAYDVENEDDSNQWLELQAEWRISKQLLSDSEYIAEENERKKWGEWAAVASEMERKRRIQLLRDMDIEEAKERTARRRWAIDAIQREQNDRIAYHFLNSVTNQFILNLDMMDVCHMK